MSSSVTLKIRLGPLVSLSVTGDNCKELNEALDGYMDLNVKVDEMCSDLSTRVYPEGSFEDPAMQFTQSDDTDAKNEKED